jgi:hypothetical protein
MVLLKTKTGSVKDGITELYKNKKTKKPRANINKIKKKQKNVKVNSLLTWFKAKKNRLPNTI